MFAINIFEIDVVVKRHDESRTNDWNPKDFVHWEIVTDFCDTYEKVLLNNYRCSINVWNQWRNNTSPPVKVLFILIVG